MKKIIIIIAAVILSSCFLRNASLDNVIQSYNLEYGLHSEYEYSSASYMVFKTGDAVIFSKANDYDSQGGGLNYDALDSDVSGSEVYEPGEYGTNHSINTTTFEKTLYLGDGTPLLKISSGSSDIVQKQTTQWGYPYVATTLDAVSGNYGYTLDRTDAELDVYEVGNWLKSASPGEKIEAAAAISVGGTGLTGFGDIGNDDVTVSGDLLAFWASSSTENFDGIVFYDISDPAASSYIAKKEQDGISGNYSTHFHLEGNELYIYGTKETDRFFYIWDVTDPAAIPAATDISTGMEDFLNNLSTPHLINGRLAVCYNTWDSSLIVLDFTDPANILDPTETPGSTWKPASDRFYPSDSITMEGDKIFIFAGNNIEVFQYATGSLTSLATGYVGVPLLGAYKFPGDPYIYALGYDSINVVSIKY